MPTIIKQANKQFHKKIIIVLEFNVMGIVVHSSLRFKCIYNLLQHKIRTTPRSDATPYKYFVEYFMLIYLHMSVLLFAWLTEQCLLDQWFWNLSNKFSKFCKLFKTPYIIKFQLMSLES